MEIGSIDYSSLSFNPIQQLSMRGFGGDTSSVQDSGASTANGPASSVDISKQAQLFSKLQSLSESDPTKFKQLMTDAANKLKSAADNSTDSQQQQFLTDLASKFQKAADTGDASAIQPEHHGHHRGSGQSRSSQNGAAAAYGQASSGALSGPDSSTRDLIKSVFDALESAVSSQ